MASKDKGKGKARELDPIEDSELTYNETVDAIVQFLEAAFHTILYLRGVYPAEIFKLHRLYSHPVYRSRHPGLNEYITTLLSSIQSELQKGSLSKIVLVLSSAQSGTPLERYIFEVAFLMPQIRKVDRTLAIKDNVTFRELGVIFRGFLMKLAVLEGGLEEVIDKEDLSFAVVIEMKEDNIRPGPGPDGDGNQPEEGSWIPADGQAGPMGLRRDEAMDVDDMASQELKAKRAEANARKSDPNAVILPVKTFDSGVINLMLYVEDNPINKASLRQYTRLHPPATPLPQERSSTRKKKTPRRRANATPSSSALDPALQLDGPPPDVEDLLLQDAAGTQSARKKGRKGIARRGGDSTKRKANGSGAGRSGGAGLASDDEDLSDSSAGPSRRRGRSATDDSSNSSSDDARSDLSGSVESIASVGDFAGYGGNLGGAGMAGPGW